MNGLSNFLVESILGESKQPILIDMSKVKFFLGKGYQSIGRDNDKGESSIPKDGERDENLIALLDAMAVGKLDHLAFLDQYTRFDKYFGEKGDGREGGKPRLLKLLKHELKLDDEVVKTIMDDYNYKDKDMEDEEYYEKYDNMAPDEEWAGPAGATKGVKYTDSGDNYDNVEDYLIANSEWLQKYKERHNLKEVSNKVMALFGGGFKPPTKGHLEVVLQGLKQTPEVNHIKILVGRGVRDGVTQNEAVEVWKKYQKFIPIESEIIPVTSPLSFYKDYLREHPEDKVYIFIGAREGDEDDLKDVAQRSEFIKRYSDNVIPTTVSTPAGVSGTLSRKYLNTDPDMFKTTLPSQLSDDEKEEIYQILISTINEGKLKDKLKNFISKVKEVTKREGKETGQLLGLLYKIVVKKHKPSPEEKKFMKGQSLDLGKLAIMGALQLIPGSTAITPLVVGLGKKYGFNVLPSEQSLNEEKIENYSHILNKIDEMFDDPFGLIHAINEIAGQTFNFTPHVDSLTNYMVDNGMNVEPLPKITYINDDDENANDLMGKTAYYDPNKQEIVLYTLNRHPKDVMRSFAHEMIHHIQNLEDRLGNITTTDTREDDHLTQIEKEAYTDGNLTFRKWTETITEAKNPQYYEFQITITPSNYSGVSFLHKNGRLIKSSTSKDDNPLTFTYKNVPSLVKAAYKLKNNESKITIWDDSGEGNSYPFTSESIKLIKKQAITEANINEMTTQEMRFWAFHSDIFSQLRKFGEEKYKEFIESAKGERRGAVNYFWNLLKKGELSERLASQESIHKFKCDCG